MCVFGKLHQHISARICLMSYTCSYIHSTHSKSFRAQIKLIKSSTLDEKEHVFILQDVHSRNSVLKMEFGY